MDKKTTDKGWAAMRQLLDREMPVENHRRRLVGWWWFVLLPAAGFGAWHWLGYNIEAEGLAALKIAALAPVPERATQSQIPANPTTVSNIGADKRASAASLPMQSNAQRLPEKTTTLQHPMMGKETEQKGQTSVGDLMNQRINTSTTPLPIENNTSPNEESVVAKTPLITVTTALKALAFQPKTIHPELEVLTVQSPKSRSKKSAGYWQWGVSASLTTERFRSVNGFSAGLNLDWHFARKWGLRTGLAYNFHRLETRKRPVASVRTSEYSSNVDGNLIIEDLNTNTAVANEGVGYYADSLGSNVLIPVGRLQRLEVPLSIFWSPLKRLKIFGGASFARTLSTTADRENYSGVYVLRLADKSAEDDASRLSSGELANWNTDAIFGGAYSFGKFELGLNAKIPVSKTFGNTYYDNPGLGNWGSVKYTPSNQRAATFSLYGIYHF